MSNVPILLIEDDEDDYVLTRDLLNEIDESHYELEWVKTFEEGLERIAADAHEVYLCDYRLGAHDGLELLVAAREGGCQAPIIMLTGQGDRSVDLKAMKAGASDYLVKGQLNATMLERSIRYAVEQHQMKEQSLRLLHEQEARAQAEEANRIKDEFLAIVSHELRNPVNVMLGWVQLLKRANSDPKTVAQALAAIERSAETQSKLIEDLLDTTRIASGTLSLEIKPLILNDVIDEALSGVKMDAAMKEINLQTSLACLPLMVNGDADRLRQAVCNLLSNAIKFTPRGGEVKVEMRKAKERAIISVADNGAGIPESFLPFVFDRYRQADGSGKQRHSGLGLGLSIVRQIVQLHDGTVQAESAGVGLGATFTITLPSIISPI